MATAFPDVTFDFHNDNRAGEFVVKATEAYEPSAEIYHSYGSHHSSHHYLNIYGFIPNGWLQGDYIAVLMPQWKGAPVGNRVTGNEKGQIAGFIGVDGHVYPEEFLKVYAFTLLRTVRPTPVRLLRFCAHTLRGDFSVCSGGSVPLTAFIEGHT